jgi:hypothetical protein
MQGLIVVVGGLVVIVIVPELLCLRPPCLTGHGIELGRCPKYSADAKILPGNQE